MGNAGRKRPPPQFAIVATPLRPPPLQKRVLPVRFMAKQWVALSNHCSHFWHRRSPLTHQRPGSEAAHASHASPCERPDIVPSPRKLTGTVPSGVEGCARSFLPSHVRAFPFEKHCFYFTVDNGK